ncbi:MFS transporter [Burkholderia sp. Tr-862]|nr:MFS transporter [Burkholderia sp. Tr-862]
MKQVRQAVLICWLNWAWRPLGRFHIRLGLLISLILLFDGYDLYNAAYIVHDVAASWQLTRTDMGFLLSSGLAGFAIGSTASGFLSDRFGRRTVLLLGCWASGVMSLAIALTAHNLASYIPLRITMGIALGLLMPVAVTYVNEVTPTRVANLFTTWFFSLGWLAGASSAGFIAAWLLPHYGWQCLYYVGALMLPVSVIFHLLPESPHFLASRSRWDELKTLLSKIRPEHASRYASLNPIPPAASPRRSLSLSLLLSSEYLPRSICYWFAGAFSLFSAYGLSAWLPTIMLQRGENLSASFAYGSLLAAAAAVGGLITAVIADALRDRRSVISVSYVLGAIAIVALANVKGHLWLGAAVASAGMFVVGSQIMLNNIVATSYPTEMRGTAVGVFLGVSRLGAMLGPSVAGMIQQWSGGYDVMFVTVGGTILATAALVFGAAPGTSKSR